MMIPILKPNRMYAHLVSNNVTQVYENNSY
jgi:hypothetical protein